MSQSRFSTTDSHYSYKYVSVKAMYLIYYHTSLKHYQVRMF